MCKYSKFFFLIVIISVSTFILYYNHIIFTHHLTLSKISYSKLPGWEQDDQTQAFTAFKKSCIDILKRDPKAAFGNLEQSKTNQSWQTICVSANTLTNSDKKSTQRFFETYFTPYHVNDNLNASGFFTGYYLPLLQ